MGPDNFIGQFLQHFQGANNSNFIQTISEKARERGQLILCDFIKSGNEDNKKKENCRLISH